MPQKTSLDELQWKEVTLPDRLDDYEGLLDLEEIEGVDVQYKNKGGNLKEVTYELADPSKKPKKEKRKKADDKASTKGVKKPKSDSSEKETPSSEERIDEGNEFAALASNDESLEKNVDVSAWSKWHLSPEMLGSLSRIGFSTPTPIQSLVVPEATAGKDIVGKAATGSGKSLAFAIPIMEHCLNVLNTKQVQALVIAPTRELAHQLLEHFEKVKPDSNLRIMAITGGLAVQKQQRLLSKHPHIVIATPGRLWSVINDNNLTESFKKIKVLVLDEADRLLQKSHFEDLQKLIDVLGNPKHTNRQTLIFSATLDENLQQRLSKKVQSDTSSEEASPFENLLKQVKFLGEPTILDADPETTVASRILEGLLECAPKDKDLHLYYLLLRYPGKTMVFANGIDDIKRISPFLNELEINAYPLHAQLDQKKRMQSLERFKKDPKGVLVCTDVAARGIDVPSVSHVVHYHVPHTADMYIHRSGRTARANEDGVSILMCSPKELSQFKRLLFKLKRRLDEFPSFPIDMTLLGVLKPRVELSHKIADLTRKAGKLGREEAWLKAAAEELGVENSEEEDLDNPKQSSQSRRNQQVAQFRSELNYLLRQRIQTGFSGKYLTSGLTNMADKLLNGQHHENILGTDPVTALDVLRKKGKKQSQKK
ncbi:ATP-dependent RNA helicase Mak5 [Schizosaccharomyces cryophilus OY26]|uniref:RNA helicase n=1 Tax=Schizosaccharomyces cryophilus (strain OY26 / ATCC MYA-4695 / CBS 11777 / NBRC 106824 / NRRL Y48691) TaxID=653667 RepID=S9X9R0_SCHCR|nr:ATP-dependent RNA helicase Mak5 [Schizosaccharomyces cryophilus OY26]EPY53882.1 ATP-dependent RNA helicase Mak5 [Schizosaccharomyces cryophilus OY26]